MLYLYNKPMTAKVRNWMHSSVDPALQDTGLWT